MAETNMQDKDNINQETVETTPFQQPNSQNNPENTAESRKKLQNTLNDVLKISGEKFHKEKASNTDRQRWARIIISAVDAFNNLLKDSELQEIEERLCKLEVEAEKRIVEKALR
jgi:uncharacterized membrane protein YccC